jgi:hypothetical protein
LILKDCADARLLSELPQNVRDMSLHGRHGDEENRRYLVIGMVGGHKRQNLDFSLRKVLEDACALRQVLHGRRGLVRVARLEVGILLAGSTDPGPCLLGALVDESFFHF